MTVVRLSTSKNSKGNVENEDSQTKKSAEDVKFEEFEDSGDYLNYENSNENRNGLESAGDDFGKYRVDEDHLNTSIDKDEVIH